MLLSTIATTDYHTGGEPFRIVSDPPVPIPGRTVAERRARAIEDPELQGLARGVVLGTARACGHVRRVHVPPDTRVVAIDFVNVPSWVVGRDVPVATSLGEVDRSPCGSGTCARLAVLAADGHTGEHLFSIDPYDPLVPGFVLR